LVGSGGLVGCGGWVGTGLGIGGDVGTTITRVGINGLMTAGWVGTGIGGLMTVGLIGTDVGKPMKVVGLGEADVGVRAMGWSNVGAGELPTGGEARGGWMAVWCTLIRLASLTCIAPSSTGLIASAAAWRSSPSLVENPTKVDSTSGASS
jgi:hypothetical protein